MNTSCLLRCIGGKSASCRLFRLTKRGDFIKKLATNADMPLDAKDKLRDKIIFEPFSAKFHNEAMQLLLKSFKYDEPMNGAMEKPLTDAQVRPVFERVFIDCAIRDKVSIVAIEKATGRLLGVYISSIHKRGDSEDNSILTDSTNPLVVILDFLDIVSSGIWDLLPPDVNSYIKNEIASVLEEYRSLKLGGTMKEMSMEAGRRLGCQYAVAVATARQSQRMNERLGFELLRFINYADYRVLGKRPFVNMDPIHVRAQLMTKRLT